MPSPADLLARIEAELGPEDFEEFLRGMLRSLPDPDTLTEDEMSNLMINYCLDWWGDRGI